MFTSIRTGSETIERSMRATGEGKRMKSWSLTRWLSTAVVAVLGLTIFASAAVAKGGGQLESWGAKGTGNGQFLLPGMIGVDPSNGTVYTGDITSGKANYRIQQLSP